MPGIMDLVASGSPEGGGLDSFFNSPIGMVLMPRTAARFQDVRRQNMLLAQTQRKMDFAMRFAQSIKDTDPMNAAAIMADPSVIDNVLTMYNNDRVWKEQHGIERQEKLLDQQTQFDLDKKKAAYEKSLLDANTTQHQQIEKGIINDAVQPTGVMANPKVQGPRPEGELQQGQTTDQISSSLLRQAMIKTTGIEDLSPQEAVQIMLDPKALDQIRQNRIAARNADIAGQNANTAEVNAESTATNNEATARGRTITVRIKGEDHILGYNPETGKYDIDMGQAKPDASAAELNARVQTMMAPDGKPHIYGYNPKTQRYDIDMGIEPPKGSYTVGIDENGQPKITFGSGGANKGPTESEAKGNSLYEGARNQFTTAVDNWDELALPRNAIGNQAGEVGKYAMTEGGQRAANAIKQVAQNYIYALSGQQAPDSEVARIMSLAMPSPSDFPGTRADKKILLYSMMRAIKSRTSKGLKEGELELSPENYNKAKLDPNLKVADPTAEIPPLDDLAKKHGIKPEYWAQHPELWPED